MVVGMKLLFSGCKIFPMIKKIKFQVPKWWKDKIPKVFTLRCSHITSLNAWIDFWVIPEALIVISFYQSAALADTS